MPGTGLLRMFAGERTGPAGPPGSTQSIAGYTVPAQGALPAAGERAGFLVAGPLGAGAGAGIGLYIERKMRGEPVTPYEVGMETALSFLPEAAESTVRGVARQMGRMSRGGGQLRMDEVARRAHEVAPRIFDAPERQATSALFDQVRQSGVRMDATALVDELQRLTPGKYADVLSEIQRLDTQHKTGGRFATLFESLRQGNTAALVQGADIGDLQQLHSALRVRGDSLKAAEARQLLRDVNDAVDATIFSGGLKGTPSAAQQDIPEVLRTAREQWARIRRAEDLGQLLTTSPVSKLTHGGEMRAFDLNRLLNMLSDNRAPLAQSVNRAFVRQPEAGQQFTAFLDEMRRLLPGGTIQLSDTQGLRRFAAIAGADRMLSAVLTHPTGQRLFRDAILEGRGRLSINALAEIVNTMRREEFGPGAFPGAPPPTTEEAPATR